MGKKATKRVLKNQNFFKRLGYAFQGIASGFRHEASFRTHILAAIFAFGNLAFFHAELIWWVGFTMVIALVLCCELFNTALEHSLDFLHPGRHPAVKISKDCAAGATLIASLAALFLYGLFIWDQRETIVRFFS